MGEIIPSNGYFTTMRWVTDTPAAHLELRLGYRAGALSAGWKLASSRFPIAATNIDLRGSTRWKEGRLKSGKLIGEVIAARADVSSLAAKVSAFFDRGPMNRPAKVFPLAPLGRPEDYQNAEEGIPQFKLLQPIEWVVLAHVAPGQHLRISDVKF